MKWIDNLKEIATSGSAGQCPICGSDNTDYIAKIVNKETKAGHMTVWCNDCKNAYHVSRMQVSEDMKTEGNIPVDLKL